MPISKYYDDGTVDIYNSKTGEVRKKVRQEELSLISPKLAVEYQANQDPKKILERKKAEKELQVLEAPAVEEQGSSEQKFNTQQAQKGLEEAARAWGRGDPANIGTKKDLALSGSSTKLGRLGGKLEASARSFVDSNYSRDLKQYEANKALLVGALTQLTGSGAPQDAEAKRLLDSMPTPTSTPEEAKMWFSSMSRLFGKDIGLKQDEADKIKNEMNPVVDFLFGSSLRFAQDVGTGLAMKGKTGQEMFASQNEALKMADKARAKAMEIKDKDPEQAKRLFKVAEDAYQVVGMNMENMAGSFSEDIEKPYAQRGLEVGLEAGTLLAIPAAAAGAVKGAKGATTLVKNMSDVGIKKAVSKVPITKAAIKAAGGIDNFVNKQLKSFGLKEGTKAHTLVKTFLYEKVVEKVSGKRIDLIPFF